ncbi:MAG TPA: class I SAM-dependent methyltransferase [Acidiphilium sp.]
MLRTMQTGGSAASEYRNEAGKSGPAVPMPPEQLRARVSGSLDDAWFDTSGTLTVDEWRRALASQGKTFRDFPTIIDFGCGCGRALRHLSRETGTGQRLIGLDPDAEAVGWVARNIAGVSASALDDLPPFRDGTPGMADLILSHSVFTHLPEDVQFAWLGELARLLKPGGTLIASVHGAKVVEDFAASLPMAELAGHVRAEMARTGFFHMVGKNQYETVLPQYYGAAFHNISYISRNWSRDFEIKAWFPVFALNHQDVLVLRRR